jgi:hypothetical protein
MDETAAIWGVCSRVSLLYCDALESIDVSHALNRSAE